MFFLPCAHCSCITHVAWNCIVIYEILDRWTKISLIKIRSVCQYERVSSDNIWLMAINDFARNFIGVSDQIKSLYTKDMFSSKSCIWTKNLTYSVTSHAVNYFFVYALLQYYSKINYFVLCLIRNNHIKNI